MTVPRLAARMNVLVRPVKRSFLPLAGALRLSSSGSGPVTVIDGGFWKSLVPKPLRKTNRNAIKSPKSKEWNPATFFIVMFLFIGSMSIQMIALRNQSERYVRQSAVRMGQLREALRKLQNGELVDLDRLRGDGPGKSLEEMEWDEMWKAVERDEAVQSTERDVAEAGQSQKQGRVTIAMTRTVSAMLPPAETSPPAEASSAELPLTNNKPANLNNFF